MTVYSSYYNSCRYTSLCPLHYQWSIPVPAKPIPKKRGPKPKPLSQKYRNINNTFSPEEVLYLEAIGNGAASSGLQVAIRWLTKHYPDPNVLKS